MSIRRFLTPRRCIFVTFSCASIALLYYFFEFDLIFTKSTKIDCYPDIEIHSTLMQLAAVATDILTKENVTHFLCYGTLWGALRHGDLLPWKREIDFCLINQELFWRSDDGYLRRLFHFRNVDLEYSNTIGVYSIWDAKLGREKGILNMYVFDQSGDQMRRIGLNRLIPIPVAGDVADAFPKQLVARPLSNVKLKGMDFPAPREGAEIQKYHYKENWWREIKPIECS